MSSSITRRIVRLERAARAAHDDGMDRDLVARLSQVEREQRLLAIRQSLVDQPAARALLDTALQHARGCTSPVGRIAKPGAD